MLAWTQKHHVLLGLLFAAISAIAAAIALIPSHEEYPNGVNVINDYRDQSNNNTVIDNSQSYRESDINHTTIQNHIDASDINVSPINIQSSEESVPLHDNEKQQIDNAHNPESRKLIRNIEKRKKLENTDTEEVFQASGLDQIHSYIKLLKKTGIENEFSGCERSADTIKCSTTVTNTEPKRIKFWLTAKRSYFEDRDGERYLGTQASHAGGRWRSSAGHVYIEPSGKLKFWVEFNVPIDAAPLESLVLGVGKKFIGDIEFRYDLIVVR